MDDDDREYDLANNYSGYNTDDDENEIDPDLEEKLYAAVFHSNDISSKNQDTPNYDNLTSLNDVVNSWKNHGDKSGRGFSNTNKKLSVFEETSDKSYPHTLPFSEEKSGCDKLGVNKSAEISHETRFDKNGDIHERGNVPVESCKLNKDQKCSEETETRHVLADREAGLDLCTEREDTRQNQREETFYAGAKSPEKYKMKKQKGSPRKSNKSKDPRGDYHSPRKSHRADNEGHDDTQAENESRNDSVVPSALGDAAESSEVKAEEELEGKNPPEKEERVLSFANQIGRVEEAMDESADIKPEEESATTQSTDHQIRDTALDEAEVKPEEAKNQEKEKESIEKAAPVGNSALISSSSNSSSSDSTSGDSSSSSSERETERSKNAGENYDQALPGGEWDEIITLDDSEGSIYEVPVPPKPRPPTINLEESESSTSSESEAETEVLSPEKLVESYRLAVSASGSRERQAGLRSNPNKQSSRVQSRRISSSSDSDDSMTESEEENWGIIAGRKMNTDKSGSSSCKNFTASEIADESTTDFDVRDSDRVSGDKDKSGDVASEERDDNLMRQSQKESYSEVAKKTSSDSSSRGVEKPSEEAERLSLPPQASKENNDKEKDAGISNIDEEAVDAIVINAESAGTLVEEMRGEVTPRRLPENRKRSITDSGKKSKNQNSPKKAKSSDDSRETAVAGSSGTKSPKENKENKEKRRNCAADYFFTPMNDEMDNFYNKSWGGENFDIDEIKRQMPKDQKHWAVLSEDLLSYQQRKSRYWTESKCRNCRHTGHNMAECPEKRKVPSCHMCGTPGHREPRCPHKMCLGCGKKQKTYMQVCNGCRRAWCDGCQSYGHVEETCPDHWRRYHVTTSHSEVNTHLNVEEVMKPQHLLSCCNCAKRGHDSTTCDNYRWSRHFPTPAYVTNYTTGPGYPEDIVREDTDFFQEARDPGESEKRPAENDAVHIGSTSSEGKKRRSNADKPEEVITGKIIEESIDEGNGEAIEKSKSSHDRVQKVREIVPANSRTKESGEILLTLRSPLLNAEFTQATNFGEYVVPLFVDHYEELTNSDLSREFLLNLTSQFPIKIEIKRSPNGELAMTIASTKDLHHPIQVTIMDWLKWPIDERSRFVSLNLPTKKQDLMRLLETKLEELKRDLGNPYTINEKIKRLKKELKRLQRLSLAGKKSATSSNRASVVESLAKFQCKLNMIFFGQVRLKKSDKSCKFLESALREMRKVGSESFICASVYLLIVHHYNIIFSAYTPDYLDNLLSLYWQRYSEPGARRDKPESWIKAHANLVQEVRNQHKTHRNRPPLILNGPIQILSENLVCDRGTAATNKGPKCNGIRAFKGFNAQNPKLKPPYLPLPQFPLIYDLDRLENNYYNSQYDFGDNSRYQRHRGGQNNHYNVEKDVNNAGGDFRRKLRSHYAGKGSPKTQGVENGLKNCSGETTQGGLSPARTRWHENSCNPPRNSNSQDMFFSDTRAEPSQSYVPNGGFEAGASRNDVEGRGGGNYGANEGASTSGMCNQQRIYCDNNYPAPQTSKQQKNGGGKNKGKKKKKNNEGGMSKSLRRRARKHIARYKDSEFPRITQAVQDLKKRFERKDLQMRDVTDFEVLVNRVKRKLN